MEGAVNQVCRNHPFIRILFLGAVTALIVVGCSTNKSPTQFTSMSESANDASATATPASPDAHAAHPLTHSHGPLSSPTDEASAYRFAIQEQFNTIVPSVERMTTLMEEPRFLDDAWKSDVIAEYTTWKTTYQQAQEMSPPPQFAGSHQRYLAALEVAANAADDYAAGLENLDLASFQAGATKIQHA
jgi:hypothetical protein